MMKNVIMLAAMVGSLTVTQAASAQTATGSLAVSLTVESGCELALGDAAGTATGGTASSTLAFGTVNVFGSGTMVAGSGATDDGNGNVIAQVGSGAVGDAATFNVHCGTGDATLAPTIALNAGANAGGGTQRFLDNNGTQIAYDLFADAARTATPYDPDTAQTLTLDVDGKAAIPIYGIARDIGTDGVEDGSYTDTVTLTLTY